LQVATLDRRPGGRGRFSSKRAIDGAHASQCAGLSVVIVKNPMHAPHGVDFIYIPKVLFSK
jgi:hypothetical protein